MPGELIVGAVVGAAAAAVASSRAGSAMRRNLLYGLGKLLGAYDKLSDAAHDVVRNARDAAASPKGTAACGNSRGETRPATNAASSPGSSP
jgi:hypothetical protein